MYPQKFRHFESIWIKKSGKSWKVPVAFFEKRHLATFAFFKALKKNCRAAECGANGPLQSVPNGMLSNSRNRRRMWKLTLLRNVKPASKSSQFPLYSRTAKVWGNVLRIDFPIYIFHFFSFSDIESHTCDWKEGEKSWEQKECQNGCSFWSTFYWFCMSHFRSSRESWSFLNGQHWMFVRSSNVSHVWGSWASERKKNEPTL